MSRDPSEFELGAAKKGGTQITERLNRCNFNYGGCGQEFQDAMFTKVAGYCHTCADRIARGFGFKPGYSNLAKMQINLPWYREKVPELLKFDYRGQCRILAYAAGSDGVLNITQKESDYAALVAKFIDKKFYTISNREEPLKQIMSQTEYW